MSSYMALRDSPSGSTPSILSESDALILGAVERSTSGAAYLWADASTTTITIGGGASQGTITIGKSGAAIDIDSGVGTWDSSAGISLDAATASNFTVTGAGQDLTLSSSGGSVIIRGTEAAADVIRIDALSGGLDVDAGASGFAIDSATGPGRVVSGGAATDLTLGARSAVITLNEAGSTTLVGFTATSIIGALNESAGAARTMYTAGAGGITQYYGVYISANNTVLHSSAAADNIASRFIGVAPSAIGAASTGPIITWGDVLMVFDGALSVTAGDIVYMSETAGKATNVAPSSGGSVVHEIGYIKDTSDYAGNTRCVVQLRPGSRLVNA